MHESNADGTFSSSDRTWYIAYIFTTVLNSFTRLMSRSSTCHRVSEHQTRLSVSWASVDALCQFIETNVEVITIRV